MEQRAVLTIDLDLASLAQETANGKKQVAGLVAELNALKREGKENTAEYTKLEATLKNTKDEVRQSASALANMTKVQNLNNGSILEMRASLSAMTKAYNSLGKEERESLEIGVKLRNNMRAQSDELKNLESAYGSNNRNVGNYKDSILEALEAQIPFVGSLRASATNFNSMATNGGQAVGMLGKLKYALAATGIGAIVLAFGLLLNYLRTLSPVMDKLAQIGAGAGEVFKRLGESVASAGKIFTDFSGTVKSVGEFLRNPIESVKKYGKELGNAAKQAANLQKAQQDLGDEMDIQEEKTAIATARIEQLLLRSRNRTLSGSERQKALKEATELDEATFQNRKKLADQAVAEAEKAIILRGRLNAEEAALLRSQGLAYAKELEDRGKAEEDQVVALKDARAARIEIIRESTNRQEKIQTRADQIAEQQQEAAEKREEKRRQLAEKIAAERLKEAEKAREAENKALDEANKAIEARQLTEEQANSQTLDRQLKRDNALRVKEMEEFSRYVEQKQFLDEQLVASEERTANLRKDIANNFLGAITENFAKHTIVGKAAFLAQKAIAIAEILVNARRAAFANTAAANLQALQASAIPFGGVALAASLKAKAAIENKLILASSYVSAAIVAAETIKGFKFGGLITDGKGQLVKGSGTGTSDSINARLSNGESVINANSTRMFMPLLSYLNQLGGGRPFDKPNQSGTYATGGVFNNQLGLSASNSVEQLNKVAIDTAANIASQMPRQILVLEDVQLGLEDKARIAAVQNQ